MTHAVALAKLPHCVQENSLLLVNALMLRALQLPSPVSACALHTELLALHLPEVRLPKLQAAAQLLTEQLLGTFVVSRF